MTVVRIPLGCFFSFPLFAPSVKIGLTSMQGLGISSPSPQDTDCINEVCPSTHIDKIVWIWAKRKGRSLVW